MDDSNSQAINLEDFENDNFNVDHYVKKVSGSIFASNIADTKDKLNKIGIQTAEEIKQSVFKNYGNFMETAKEVGHLEGKMNQLRQSLEEQRKLLNLFKNLNTSTIEMTQNAQNETSNRLGSSGRSSAQKTSLATLLEKVEGCGIINQKEGRSLIYHSDLEQLHLDDFSVLSRIHAYLLNDSLLLAVPKRKRSKAIAFPSTGRDGSMTSILFEASSSSIRTQSRNHSFEYKFQAFYELENIKILNIEDSKNVRNSFQIFKFPENLAFRCANAHVKKEWLEMFEKTKRQLKILKDIENSKNIKNTLIQEEDEEEDEDDEEEEEEVNDSDSDSDDYGKPKVITKKVVKKKKKKKSLSGLSENERSKLIREQFSDFDILLAQRDFEKAVDMLLKIEETKFASLNANDTSSPNFDSTPQQLIYKQKETELINFLKKDLHASKERGNKQGVIKTGKPFLEPILIR
jgi:exocyst complex component 8